MEPYIKNFIQSHEKEPLELDKRHLKRKKYVDFMNSETSNVGDNNMLGGVGNSANQTGGPSGMEM
jgi:hypothetical protein